MLNRRTLMLALAGATLPIGAVLAQPPEPERGGPPPGPERGGPPPEERRPPPDRAHIPPPRHEDRPPPPDRVGWRWREGHWEWRGDWVWIPGRWYR